MLGDGESEIMSLTTSSLGLTLAHPILGASPLTTSLEPVRRAEDGECAAVIMHSLFEEQNGAASVLVSRR
jgi:hypothetical protein